MSIVSRILRETPKCTFAKIFNKNQLGMLQAVRPVTIKVEHAKPELKLDHDEKNMNLKRPMSPHVTIYSQKIQGTMSISHRIMGVAMTGYLIGFGVGTLVLPQDISVYIDALNAMNIPAPVLFGARFLMVLPFTYHGINGVRHLLWDVGKLLYIKQVIASGYVVLALSAIMALGLAS